MEISRAGIFTLNKIVLAKWKALGEIQQKVEGQQQLFKIIDHSTQVLKEQHDILEPDENEEEDEEDDEDVEDLETGDLASEEGAELDTSSQHVQESQDGSDKDETESTSEASIQDNDKQETSLLIQNFDDDDNELEGIEESFEEKDSESIKDVVDNENHIDDISDEKDSKSIVDNENHIDDISDEKDSESIMEIDQQQQSILEDDDDQMEIIETAEDQEEIPTKRTRRAKQEDIDYVEESDPEEMEIDKKPQPIQNSAYFEETDVTLISPLIKHTLREYQHSGVSWLVGLHNKGLNGILADEMVYFVNQGTWENYSDDRFTRLSRIL